MAPIPKPIKVCLEWDSLSSPPRNNYSLGCSNGELNNVRMTSSCEPAGKFDKPVPDEIPCDIPVLN